MLNMKTRFFVSARQMSLALGAFAVSLAATPSSAATVTAADHQAAKHATNHFYQWLPRRDMSPVERLGVKRSSREVATLATYPKAQPFNDSDLLYFGGPVLTSVRSHNTYTDCNASPVCWGDPNGFLNDLAVSQFIHIVDQYTGSTARNRYVNGVDGWLQYGGNPSFLSHDSIIAGVHAIAAAQINAHNAVAGYNDIYHIFLPAGVDTCFADGVTCYAPDGRAGLNFNFCAYHGSVDFADLGHIVFSVEPYQAVSGCQEPQPAGGYPNGNGGLTDSTDSVLSHELFESITDPDGNAWFTESFLLRGEEIGDICAWTENPVFKLNGHNYQSQLEYSDLHHLCNTQS